MGSIPSRRTILLFRSIGRTAASYAVDAGSSPAGATTYNGILSASVHIDDQKMLLEFIDAGYNVNADSMIELSYHLRCVRDGEPEYHFKKSSFNNFQ